MHTLMIVGDYPPDISGIGDYTAVLSEALQKAGASVTVITTKQEGAPAAVLTGEGRPEVVRQPIKWSFRELGSLVRLIRSHKSARVVHIQYSSVKYGRGLMINILPVILRAFTDKTVVVTMHEFRERRTIWRMRAAPMLYGAHGIIHADPPDLPSLRKWRRGGSAQFKCVEVCSAIAPVPVTAMLRSEWRSALGFSGDAPVISYFGTAHPFKGFPTLFRALQILRRRGLDVRLVGIGLFDFRANADYQRQIAESLRPAEREGWVRALQKVSADEVSRAMHASDAAVFPFERGVTSNRSSVLSALAHGLPVVTTNGCDTPAGFADKVPVLLAPPSCPEELADTLGRVLQSPEERAELRRRALRFSAERNWSNAAEETLSFYRQVMRPNGPSDSIATRVGDERHASTGQRT